MKKNILWLLALLFPFMGLVSSCSNDDEIVFDHERPQFETQAGKILLEVVLPSTTTEDEEVYIAGAFNGLSDQEVIGNSKFQLLHSSYASWRRGIYLDPADFVASLSAGYHFVSDTRRNEVTALNAEVNRTDAPGVGTRTLVYVNQWASFFDEPEEEVDYYIPYLESADEQSIFFETDAEYCRVWAWGGPGEAALLGVSDWGERPFMELVGQGKNGKNIFKFVFGGAPDAFLITVTDANGEETSRPIDGVTYTKNGYYIDGVDYNTEIPEVITRVGAPSGGDNSFKPWIESADEESVFFETDAEYCRVWAWGGPGEAALLGVSDWGERPFLELVGKTKAGKNVFKFVFGGAPDAFIITITDENGEELSRPIDGIAYTKNGYYIDGVDYGTESPTVVTKVK